MHILFRKGLYSHLLGGCCIMHVGGKGPERSLKRGLGKGLDFDETQGEYRSQNLSNRLANLASLNIKAGGSFFQQWCQPWKSIGPTMHARGEGGKMTSACSSLEKLVALWDEADAFLTLPICRRHGSWKRVFAGLQVAEVLVLAKGQEFFWAKHHTFIHFLTNSKL